MFDSGGSRGDHVSLSFRDKNTIDRLYGIQIASEDLATVTKGLTRTTK
jgi:hypothetical protein